MIFLPRSQPPPTLRAMAMRRSSSALFGAVLALVAMLGLVAASGWHSAMVHDHVPRQVGAVDHDQAHPVAAEHDDHAPAKQTGGDGPVHLLAHVAGHWVAFDAPATAPLPTIAAARAWSILTASLPGGIGPSKLLRPPRG